MIGLHKHLPDHQGRMEIGVPWGTFGNRTEFLQQRIPSDSSPCIYGNEGNCIFFSPIYRLEKPVGVAFPSIERFPCGVGGVEPIFPHVRGNSLNFVLAFPSTSNVDDLISIFISTCGRNPPHYQSCP